MDHKDDDGAEAYLGRLAAEKLGRDSDAMITGDGRIAAFASGLKAHLREIGDFRDYDGCPDTEGYAPTPIDWPALDAAIDAFAAEFQGGGR